MDNIRKAWIQFPDFSSYNIGEVRCSEIERLWGSRWAQKCIRDAAEQVAIDRFSPVPRKKSQDFCSPQLGFESDGATLAISPCIDIKPAILYGVPLHDFETWTVYLSVKRGRKLLGVLPLDYSFEMIVTQEEALELVRLFFKYNAVQVPLHARVWRSEINHRYRYRLVGAFFV